MKKNFIVLMLLGAVVFACQHESLEQRCTREAREYTKKYCPAPAGKDVYIDSMTFVAETHTLCYYYRITGDYDSRDVITAHRQDLRKVLLTSLKQATIMKSYKDEGYNFRYVYFSNKNKGMKLLDETFTKRDYIQ
jgi:hypothetical protein